MARSRIRDFCPSEQPAEAKHSWPNRPKVAATQPPAIEQNWAAKLKAVAEQISAKAENNRVEQLEQKVRALEAHCKQLRDGQSIIVPITTLDPEPFELRKEILVVVQPDDDSFVATFFDANVNASGNTQVDAVANLKDMLIALFVSLEKEPKLAKGPACQLAILREVVRKKG